MALRQLNTITYTPTSVARIGDLGFATWGPLTGITRVRVTYLRWDCGVILQSCADLVTVEFPNLVSIDYNSHHGSLIISGNPNLTSVDMPAFVDYTGGNVDMSTNAALTTVNLPVWIPGDGLMHTFSGCALNVTSVNLILARCVANPNFGITPNSRIFLQGGTSAAPNGQGITDKNTLIGRGATVQTN